MLRRRVFVCRILTSITQAPYQLVNSECAAMSPVFTVGTDLAELADSMGRVRVEGLVIFVLTSPIYGHTHRLGFLCSPVSLSLVLGLWLCLFLTMLYSDWLKVTIIVVLRRICFYEFLTRNNLAIFVFLLNLFKVLTSVAHKKYCGFTLNFFFISTDMERRIKFSSFLTYRKLFYQQ